MIDVANTNSGMSASAATTLVVLQPGDWRAERATVLAELEPFAAACEERRSRNFTHPVDDFIFDYYSLRPSRLRRWSPGPGVLLLDATIEDVDHGHCFVAQGDGIMLPAYPDHRRMFLRWLIEYWQAVAARPPAPGCFGLHEWAMVYQTEDIRHATTPLRLTAAGIAEVVESNEVRCTHFDAFRFFTPAAKPRNRIALSRAATSENDQPGCVHVTMDLF